MKKIKNIGAQGDVLFRRVNTLPEGAEKIEWTGNAYTVAHSETGHHHVLERPRVAAATLYRVKDGELGEKIIAQLEAPAPVRHERSFDTHETIELPAGLFEIRRQREATPEGWQRVMD